MRSSSASRRDCNKATRWIWICLLLLFLAVFALSSPPWATAEETTNVVDLKLVIPEPDSYRRKLMRTVRDHLSVNDERRIDSAGVTVGQITCMDGVDRRVTGIALDNIEGLMLRAAAVQT